MQSFSYRIESNRMNECIHQRLYCLLLIACSFIDVVTRLAISIRLDKTRIRPTNGTKRKKKTNHNTIDERREWLNWITSALFITVYIFWWGFYYLLLRSSRIYCLLLFYLLLDESETWTCLRILVPFRWTSLWIQVWIFFEALSGLSEQSITNFPKKICIEWK